MKWLVTVLLISAVLVGGGLVMDSLPHDTQGTDRSDSQVLPIDDSVYARTAESLRSEDDVVAEARLREPAIPALPGIEGFALGSYGRESARALGAEYREPVWALEMESRIASRVRQYSEIETARIEIECRASMCGILLIHDLASDADQMEFLQGTARLRSALKEDLQFRDDSGVTSFRSSGNFSAIYLIGGEGREKYAAPPPTVPAIPGVAGFDIPRGDRPANLFPPLYLANQPDRPEWSIAMEARILDEISREAIGQVTQVFVECRSSVCGIVLGYTDSSEIVGPTIGETLANELGFRRGEVATFPRGDAPFGAIYLHNGPPMRFSQ